MPATSSRQIRRHTEETARPREEDLSVGASIKFVPFLEGLSTSLQLTKSLPSPSRQEMNTVILGSSEDPIRKRFCALKQANFSETLG